MADSNYLILFYLYGGLKPLRSKEHEGVSSKVSVNWVDSLDWLRGPTSYKLHSYLAECCGGRWTGSGVEAKKGRGWVENGGGKFRC